MGKLNANGIRARGAIALADALGYNQCLTQLDLAHNSICSDTRASSDAAVRALGAAIEKNWTLQTLNLHQNSISPESRRLLRDACLRNNERGGGIQTMSIGRPHDGFISKHALAAVVPVTTVVYVDAQPLQS